MILKLIIISALLLVSCSDDKEVIETSGNFTCKFDKVVPDKYFAGDTISILGSNLGKDQGDNYLVFVGSEESGGSTSEVETYLKWGNEEIVFVVPEGDTKGRIYMNSKLSNGLDFTIEKSIFIDLIQIFVQISLFITVVFIYLQMNKIWKRKHEREVADSQSLIGLSIYVMNCILWVFYYIFVEDDPMSTIDTSIYIFQGSLLFMIGTGVFVKGQRKEGLWILIRKALKLERKEADYLLKKWFKPQNAEVIIHILHQIAMIDEEFDPKEQDIIQTFAKEWNIDYDWEKLEKERKASKDNSYIRLRKSLEDYLFREPQDEQVAQLKDMITTMIEADDKVTEEEALISSELLPMIENYLKENKDVHEYKVLIVPQNPNQEESIKNIISGAEKISTSGGEAFTIGTYYSQKYAEMMCEQYRSMKYFTIVSSPPGSQN